MLTPSLGVLVASLIVDEAVPNVVGELVSPPDGGPVRKLEDEELVAPEDDIKSEVELALELDVEDGVAAVVDATWGL